MRAAWRRPLGNCRNLQSCRDKDDASQETRSLKGRASFVGCVHAHLRQRGPPADDTALRTARARGRSGQPKSPVRFWQEATCPSRELRAPAGSMTGGLAIAVGGSSRKYNFWPGYCFRARLGSGRRAQCPVPAAPRTSAAQHSRPAVSAGSDSPASGQVLTGSPMHRSQGIKRAVLTHT